MDYLFVPLVILTSLAIIAVAVVNLYDVIGDIRTPELQTGAAHIITQANLVRAILLLAVGFVQLYLALLNPIEEGGSIFTAATGRPRAEVASIVVRVLIFAIGVNTMVSRRRYFKEDKE